MEKLNEFLKRIRTDSGLTQAQMGEKLGYSQTQIVKIENGSRFLTLSYINEWCRACNVDPKHAKPYYLNSDEFMTSDMKKVLKRFSEKDYMGCTEEQKSIIFDAVQMLNNIEFRE